MSRKINCPVLITEEENWIVATDVNSNVASQGKSITEAMNNLKEALSLYYEERNDYEYSSSTRNSEFLNAI